MKNKCYMAYDDGVAVKVLKSDDKVIQEMAGIHAFRPFVLVPSITKIDTRTIELSLLTGKRADLISISKIEELTLNLFRKIHQRSGSNSGFNINEKIETFRIKFQQFPGLVKVLNQIQLVASQSHIFPVHGDLQKQNIFLSGQELGLIDFEHFIVAPQELELANSFFFKDHNCLPVERLTSQLIKEKIVNKNMLSLMICFYAIHQLCEGRKQTDVQSKYERALQRLQSICGTVDCYPLHFKKRYVSSVWHSTCFT